MKRILIFLCMFTLLTGCATIEKSVQDAGGGILKFVGLLPGASTVSSVEGLVQATKTLSPEEEYYLGRGVSARLLTKYTPAADPSLQHYIATVGATVAAGGEAPQTFGGYHFVLLEAPEVNAISAPGGYIFITRGMLDLLADEDSLAAVLAHEIAHVSGHHGVRALNRDKLSTVVANLGTIAGSMSCNQVLSNATVLFGATIDDMISTLLDNGYSKELEYEADAEAVKLLERAGYEPRALEAVLASLALSDSIPDKKIYGWFKTHPPAAARKMQIAKIMPPSIESPMRPVRRDRFLAAL